MPNVEFRVADVQVEDLGAGMHDAAFSRFGVMFFADPVAAFANVGRALRGGGTLSFVCWQSVFDNEWMLVPGMAAISATGVMPPMPRPDEPGPFSLADPERVRALLGAAGFVDVDVADHRDQVVATDDRLPAIVEASVRMGVVREALREADEATRQQVLAAIEQALRDRVDHGELRLSRAVLLVRATAPGLD